MNKFIFLKLLVFGFFISFFACTEKEEVEPLIENQADIKIEGVDYSVFNSNIIANENCESLFVNVSYRDENKISFRFKLEFSKEGDLRKVWYDEYILPSTSSKILDVFLTPTFDPTSTFDISDFFYNKEFGELYFNFGGTVFYEHDNTVRRYVSGEIKVKSVLNSQCSVAETEISYDSDNLKLYVLSSGATKNNTNQTQSHQFNLSNGYSINFRLSGDLWNYPFGEIEFDENQILDRINFRKAIGPMVANQTGLDQEWKNFETSGKIIVEQKYIEVGKKRISGKLNLLVKDKGEIVYMLDDIKFKTWSFEN